MDDIIIGLKNLAIQLAGEGINYAVDSVADMIIPKKTLNADLKSDKDAGDPFQVIRIISAQGSDGTYQDFTIKFTLQPTPKMLKTYNLYSKTLISKISCASGSPTIVKLSDEDFTAECTCTLENSTNVKGGVSILNGVFEITW